MEFVYSHFVLPFSHYAIAFCFLIFVSVVSYYETHELSKSLIKGVLVSYVFLVYCVTILSRPILSEHVMYLNPFRNFVYIKAFDTGVILEALLNMALLFPVGLLLPSLTNRKKSFIFTVIIGFLISLSIESIQWYTKAGWFETQDLMNNTIGVIVGYSIQRLLVKGK